MTLRKTLGFVFCSLGLIVVLGLSWMWTGNGLQVIGLENLVQRSFSGMQLKDLSITTDELYSTSRDSPTVLNLLTNKPAKLYTSYMLSLTYAEQLSNSFHHYNSFISLANRWNLTGVIPFVMNSRMFGLQSFKPKSVDIRLLFDMNTFEKTYSKCLGRNETGLIYPITSFLQNSYRRLVIVYFSWHMFILGKKIHHKMDEKLNPVFAEHKETAIVDCSDTAKSILSPTIEQLLIREQNMYSQEVNEDGLFSIATTLCVNPGANLSLTDMMDRIKSELKTLNDEASVLFVSWQGKFTRAFNDTMQNMFTCTLPYIHVPFSSEVKKQAVEFVKSKNFKSNGYISVHIRFEKIFMFAADNRKSKENEFYDCCMKRLDLLLQAISREQNISLNNTLLVHDYGTFGSDSCRFNGKWTNQEKFCQPMVEKCLNKLGVTASEYIPYDGHNNTGFISLVEQESLFNGRVLVTVGTGAFQDGVKSRFIEHHSKKTYQAAELSYHVCYKEKLNGIEIDHPTC